MSNVDLSAVLSEYVVAKVKDIPEGFNLDHDCGRASWKAEGDLLVVECDEADERRVLIEDLKKQPWVTLVSVWVGCEPRRMDTIGEILHMAGNDIAVRIGDYEIALLIDSRWVVNEMEDED